MNIGSGFTDERSGDPVPDSEVCRDAEGLLRRTSQPALVNHCLRSYLWGAALADAEGVTAYPRLDFVKVFGDAFVDQAGRKPSSSAAHAVRHGLLERLAACPLNERQEPARPDDRAGPS